ncbi:YggS family pyridoxal phosphate-dependent enzyme [Undibacterium crateris]|uniref:YggS family pyridoxal phosphate-dependent enzyme n=1 Tax=Undibacterium crateris TaxID=2528175 RepID=UPI0013895E9D|nr:YggS family pyridoxal phosphate-dependent enzyme [Undibacterium crateris]NDI86142.1 YggS family pyridoxal phosphate-dependent enzyme [Undibacterium crateris]
MSLISDNLQAVSQHIRATEKQYSRPPLEVKLLAVSKTFPVQAIIEAAQWGQVAFGENYLQEALDKIQFVRENQPELALEWHFIGPIQSNKTRAIAENFHWVHSVDREKIAIRLSEQRPATLPPLNICLQINVSGEASKSGVPPTEAVKLALRIASLPNLRLRGLMAVPEPSEDVAEQRAAFAALRQIQETLQQRGLALDTLSMGMSSDLDAAIAEGSTIVRIGTAIFGKRDYAK